MEINIGEIIVDEEIEIGEIIVDDEINIGDIELDFIKIFPELENLEITPSIAEQNFKSNKYGYNNVTIKGVTSDIDEDIQADNIRKGINILGVEGNYEGTDTSDATATADDILKGKTAYANNEEIVGTIEEYDGSFEGSAKEGAKITDASYLFYKGARIDHINELLALCENVSSCENMFYSCSKLTELDLSKFDTSNITTMSYMFYSCSGLSEIDVSKFDTTNVTAMSYVFYSCSGLSELDLSTWNTSNVKYMASMFTVCSNLTKLDVSKFDTSNVTDMGAMFHGCEKITSLDLSNFDMSKVNKVSYILNYLNALTNLKSFKDLGKGYTQKSNNYSNYKLDLKSSTNLTHESLMDLITNGLYDLNLTYDVANGGTLYTQQLVLGSTNMAKLSSSELQIATDKGWVVS